MQWQKSRKNGSTNHTSTPDHWRKNTCVLPLQQGPETLAQQCILKITLAVDTKEESSTFGRHFSATFSSLTRRWTGLERARKPSTFPTCRKKIPVRFLFADETLSLSLSLPCLSLYPPPSPSPSLFPTFSRSEHKENGDPAESSPSPRQNATSERETSPPSCPPPSPTEEGTSTKRPAVWES